MYDTLLYVLSSKKEFYRFKGIMKPHVVSPEVSILLDAIDSYFKKNPSLLEIDYSLFIPWFKMSKGTSVSKEKMFLLDKLFERLLDDPPSEEDKKKVLEYILEQDYCTKISDYLIKVNEGDDTKSLLDIESFIRDYKIEADKVSEVDEMFDDTDVDEIIDNHLRPGLEWRLEELNRSLGPLRKGDLIIVTSAPDSGKCLAPDTPILLAGGDIKLAKDIKVGDVLAGPFKNNTVLSTTSGRDAMYRIQYKNGDYYEVNEPHILSLKKTKRGSGEIVNVSVAEYLTWCPSKKSEYKGWKAGIEFPYTPIVPKHIDPYILGVWLGDGHSKNTMFTNADESVWRCVLSYTQDITKDTGDKYYLQSQVGNTGAAISARVTHGIQGKANVMKESLRELNLLNNKHIPKLYLHNHSDVRKNVLAGLLDTDGSVSRSSGYEITQKSKALAEDILYLARSLGYAASMNEKIVGGKWYWRIHMYGDFSGLPMQVEHKKLNKPHKPKRKGLHFGFDVIPLGEGEYVGWELDGDKLFMLGDFTVTHNTTFLCSESTFMAPQMQEDQDVIWFNNEEQVKKVRHRIFQATLGWTKEELADNKLVTRAALEKALCRLDRIKVVDDKLLSVHKVEEVLANSNPGLIIFDQLWKVTGFTDSFSEVDKQNQLFSWARSLADKYAPVINVHQADGTAQGEAWIQMHQLYNSRVGIQGEADAIIGIGRSYDPSVGPTTRFIHVSKNKLDGGPKSVMTERNGKYEVEIVPHKARYKGTY